MTTTPMTVAECYDLAYTVLQANGCDEANATALATTMSTAERDGSVSHGLFRLPATSPLYAVARSKGTPTPKLSMLPQPSSVCMVTTATPHFLSNVASPS